MHNLTKWYKARNVRYYSRTGHPWDKNQWLQHRDDSTNRGVGRHYRGDKFLYHAYFLPRKKKDSFY